jgi:glycerophosphoryl diester phosphodiesterase
VLRTVLLALAFAVPQGPVLNIADQGGEAELPSNTMYAFREAVASGADMLALDVQATQDGRLVAMRDLTVDPTTDGTGYVADLTLARIRRLDAAFHSPLRGVRTGDRRPPRGFKRADFRVPTLAEVLQRFPRTPLDIEIKGRDEAQAVHTAELAAALLQGTQRGDLIVTASSQAAIDRFRELVPELPVPRVVALDATATTAEAVLQAHQAGYTVHVTASSGYGRLLRMCVDGIVTAAPSALERRLPEVDPCSVRATRAMVEGRTVAVGLERRGLGPQAYEGMVTIRSRGRLVGREAFSLAEGTEAGGVTVALTRFGRRLLRDGGRVAVAIAVRTRGARSGPQVTRVRL